jgi:hypothetical protein
MKSLFLTLMLAAPMLIKAQAHLGESLSGLKSRYPDKFFKIQTTNDGTTYTTAEQPLGTFVYYFHKETGLTNLCVQIPNNTQALSAQIEIYNGKYVIISDKKWKAYLDGGTIMNIDLMFSDDLESFVFFYSSAAD